MNKLLLTTAVGALLLSTIQTFAGSDVSQLINATQNALNEISGTSVTWPLNQNAINAADLIDFRSGSFGDITQTVQGGTSQLAHNVINFGSNDVSAYLVTAKQVATDAVNVVTLDSLSGKATQISNNAQQAINEVIDHSGYGALGYTTYLDQEATAAANIFSSGNVPNKLDQSAFGSQFSHNYLSVLNSVTNVTQNASNVANVLTKAQ